MIRTPALGAFIAEQKHTPARIEAEAARQRGGPAPARAVAREDQALAGATSALRLYGLDPDDPDDRAACWAVLGALSLLAVELERLGRGERPERYISMAAGGLNVLLAGKETP